MAKRDLVYERIMQGGATREDLMEVADVDSKGLASQMTYLRMMGKCPMKQQDGTYTIVSSEEWEAHRASSAGARAQAALTPEERVEKAHKRESKAASTVDRTKKLLEANPDNRLKELQHTKALCEFEIAQIMVHEAEQELQQQPDPSAEVVSDFASEESTDEFA